MISRLELAEVIGERTMHISDSAALAKSIAGYLLEQSRTDDIESLMRDVLKYRANHGHVEATVVSAYALGVSERAAIMHELKNDYPKAQNIALNEQIDETLVGGVRLEMAGEELDLTVRAKLNKLKRLTAARNK